MDSIVAGTINDSSFGYTEVATGGANKRGRVKRLADVEPHGADFYTSVYDHGPDFEDYINEHGTCKGYKGAVKPRGVHFDIDRPDIADALTDTRTLVTRLHSVYGVPTDTIRLHFSGSKGFHVEVPGVVTSHKPDLDHFPAQLDLCVDDPARVFHAGSQGLLAEDRLPVTQALRDQPGVGIVRRRDNDGVYAVVLDQRALVLEDRHVRTAACGQLLGPREV